jgi:hypothetical protein
MLVLQGMTDSEVAADPTVHVSRSTVWHWRMEDVIFKAELQQRRAAIWSSTLEKLRGLMSKAIENITVSVESGNVADSWNLLKCIGLFGDGTGNAVHGAHIEHELRQRATNQARHESDLLIQDHGPRSIEKLSYRDVRPLPSLEYTG